MNDLTNTVNEINRLHQQANSTAQQAIDYAKELGRLLLKIKKELPHGKFTSWLEKNSSVSVRQAQRYMEAASGRKIKLQEIATKNDMKSFLSDDEFIDKLNNPNWIPKLGHWHLGCTENAGFWIVPDLDDINFFHISKLYTLENTVDRKEDCETLYHGSILAVHQLSVDAYLHCYGIDYPEHLEWKTYKREGLVRPFGEPKAETEKFYRRLDL